MLDFSFIFWLFECLMMGWKILTSMPSFSVWFKYIYIYMYIYVFYVIYFISFVSVLFAVMQIVCVLFYEIFLFVFIVGSAIGCRLLYANFCIYSRWQEFWFAVIVLLFQSWFSNCICEISRKLKVAAQNVIHHVHGIVNSVIVYF